MWTAAAETSSDGNNSVPTTLIVLIVGGIIYSFGFLRARWVQARNTYKGTKAAVKPLRKAKWAIWRRAAGVGAIVLFALFLLGSWVWHDVTEEDTGNQPVPASSVEPSPSKR